MDIHKELQTIQRMIARMDLASRNADINNEEVIQGIISSASRSIEKPPHVRSLKESKKCLEYMIAVVYDLCRILEYIDMLPDHKKEDACFALSDEMERTYTELQDHYAEIYGKSYVR